VTEPNLAVGKYPNVQWKVDNIEQIEKLLEQHETRVKQIDDNLLIQGWGGLNIMLEPGDCLMLDGDRLGIVRAVSGAAN